MLLAVAEQSNGNKTRRTHQQLQGPVSRLEPLESQLCLSSRLFVNQRRLGAGEVRIDDLSSHARVRCTTSRLTQTRLCLCSEPGGAREPLESLESLECVRVRSQLSVRRLRSRACDG